MGNCFGDNSSMGIFKWANRRKWGKWSKTRKCPQPKIGKNWQNWRKHGIMLPFLLPILGSLFPPGCVQLFFFYRSAVSVPSSAFGPIVILYQATRLATGGQDLGAPQCVMANDGAAIAISTSMVTLTIQWHSLVDDASGGLGPAASPRRPLETVLRQSWELLGIMYRWIVPSYSVCVLLGVLSLVMQSLSAVVLVIQDWLRAGPSSWGLSALSDLMCGYCATGGGSCGGGVFGPLGTTVPWGDSPREGRAAHGPAPPPCSVNSPENLLMSMSGCFSL